MKPSEYIDILKSNQKLDKENAAVIEEIIEEYPYFQSARSVYIKYLHETGSFKYNANLKRTAAHTLDRTVLFDYITSTEFQGIDNIKPIWVKTPTPRIQLLDAYVCNVSEEFPIVHQITLELLAPKVKILPAEIVIESIAEVEIRKVNVNEEFLIVHQITLELLTPRVKILPAEIVIESIAEVEIRKVNVNEEFLIVHQITLELLTPRVKILPAEVVIESIAEVEIRKVDVNVEFPIVHQVTLELLAPKTELILKEEIAELTPIEEALEIGKPLAFEKNENHSFQEWLQLTAMTPIVREETTQTTTPIEIVEQVYQPEEDKKQDLIDRFIENNPRMPRAKGFEISDKDVPSPVVRPRNNTLLMTETLAKVYLEQKKYDKAIQAYEILILKNPEKSSLFADRIDNIKILKNNNS